MRPKQLLSKIVILFILLVSSNALCLSGKDIVQLKQGGVSDQTIEVMIREKVIETCAFTVAEILALKDAGVSEKTIHVLIQERSFAEGSQPIVYGKDIDTVRLISPNDIVQLKSAGVSEEVIQTIISHGRADLKNVADERALDILKDMEIIIDGRQSID